MSYTINEQVISGVCNGDLTTKQYYLVIDDADGVAVNTTAGGIVLGALSDPGTGDNTVCGIAVGGVTKVIAGGEIAKGAAVESTNAGKAVTAGTASESYPFGIALEAATADGDIIAVLMHASTAQMNA